MNNQPLDKELDPTPLVTKLVEKTKAGRLKWETTLQPKAYIASVGGDTTLKIVEESEERDEFGRTVTESYPVLSLIDENGRTLWEIYEYQVNGGLSPLFKLAQRVGNKLDERMETLIGAVEKL